MPDNKCRFVGERVKLGELIEASTLRNKGASCQTVYSVTNSQGFVPSADYFNKEVFSKELNTYRIVKRGMIAYNPSRINVGSVALQDKSDEVVVSPLYIVFSTNAEKLLPAYLVRFLKSVPGQSQVAFQSTGTVRSNLKFEALSRISIFLPALAEQERRVAKLKSIEHQISLAEKQIALLDQLVKSRFVEMFIETGKPNPVVCLGDYCKHINNGITRRGNDTEGSIVLRLVELQEGFIDYSSVNRMVLTDREKAKFLLNDGDILFARVNGNPDNVGRCSAFFGIGEPVFHNDHIIRATIAPGYFEPIYIAQFVNSPFGREQICKGLKTSAGQYTINQEGIANVQIPLPPLSLQQEFASFVSQVDKSQFVVRQQIEKLQTLYDSLAQEYFA